MANIAISALPAATTGAGADQMAIVQSGTTKSLTMTALFASPRPIGATTPLAGAFTTLTGTGAWTNTPASDVSPLVLKGHVGATATLFDVQQSDATSIFKVGVGAVATSVVAVGSTLEWSGTTGALTVAGGVYIAKKAMVIGDFAVATNKFTVAAASGNTVVAGTLNVTLDAKVAAAKSLVQGMTNFPLHSITTLTSGASVTYTAAQVLGGLISDTITEANAATFPAAANVVAAIAGCAVGTSFDFYVKNTAGSAIAITLTAGTGNTLVGTATIAQANTKHVRAIVTNITGAAEAVTYYSLGTAVH